MTININANVAIDIQSALATAVAIDDVSNANPAVVTHSGLDPVDGDYLLLTATGMTQLNQRVVRVQNAGAGTFELENVDSTLFGDFIPGTSVGTFETVTYGLSLGTITDFDSGGGEFEFADASVVHSNERAEVPTVSAPITLDLQSFFDTGDVTLKSLKTISDTSGQRAIRIRWPTSQEMLFFGFISAPGIPTGAIFEIVKTAISLRGTKAQFV